MSANQIQRLRILVRQKHTPPTFLQEKKYGWNKEKTADKLIFGLDWDGSQEDLDRVRFESDLRQENEILRRQVQVLLQQIASGSKSDFDVENFSRSSRAHFHTTGQGESDKMPQLPLINLPKDGSIHPSGSQTERADRPSAPHAPPPRQSIIAHPPDAKRRFPLIHRHDRATERDGDEGKRARRDHDGRARGAEAELLAATCYDKQVLSERMWGMEECLAAKDEELELQRAELEHLRFLIGVKEGDEAHLVRRLAFLEGRPAGPPVFVDAGASAAEAGRQLLRQVEGACFRMEDYLRETEEHLAAGEEQDEEAGHLMVAVDGEARRREADGERALLCVHPRPHPAP